MRIDVIRRAAEIYLAIAYPSGSYPANVARRMTWPEGLPPRQMFAGPPFERTGKPSENKAQIFALRLGNQRYPHMKLQFQPWDNEDGLMLSVNTHDQITSATLTQEDARAFRELQAENQRLKEQIEQAWEVEGLPTFLHFLRSYIESRTETPPAEG